MDEIKRGDIIGDDLQVRWDENYDGMRSCCVQLFYVSLARFLFHKGLYMIVFPKVVPIILFACE